MFIYRSIFLATLIALPLVACDKVVEFNADQNESYAVKGDSRSDFYPLEIKRDGEDVRIRLKNSEPTLEIVSLDPAGHALPFYFKVDGNSLIVPGKFDHLLLRRVGSETIDISKVNGRR